MVMRPLVVAIAHLPILILSLSAIPVVLRPATHGELALRMFRELRTWSREVIAAAYGGPAK